MFPSAICGLLFFSPTNIRHLLKPLGIMVVLGLGLEALLGQDGVYFVWNNDARRSWIF